VKVISLKNHKKFLIYSSVIILFLLLSLIISINFFEYKRQKHILIDNIKHHLELCSYKLNCKDVKISFVSKKNHIKLFNLEESKNNFYMIFGLKFLKKYYLKLSLDKKNFYNKLNNIKKNFLIKFIIEFLIIIIITGIIVFILLIPLKEAYKLNEEFIKDILHDLNTPLTALKLNLFILKKKYKNDDKIKDIEQNIQTIIAYQKKLKNYLNLDLGEKTKINLKKLIDNKLKFYSNLYPSIEYKNLVNCNLTINESALSSILDNIISNAFKYNKENGKIIIYMKDKKLIIKDTGIGIKDTKKVFNRFYKETERGIGVGMNIVKKYCDALDIPIKIESNSDGTTVILDLSNYC